jgi:toxin ParE1/3/4
MASCMDLANNPQLGKSYEILALNVLGYKCGQHIIFYRKILKNEIEIERVLHGMMDLKNNI